MYSVGLFLNESSLFPTEPRRCVWQHKGMLVTLVLDLKRLSQPNQNYETFAPCCLDSHRGKMRDVSLPLIRVKHASASR